MDYNFNEEQELLKKTANSFLANECDSLFVREMEKDPKGITPEIWKKMAELGWMGVVFPEEYGGIGGNFLDLMILLYEMGYAITTGPFFSTVILGGMTILEAADDNKKQELLTAIAEGKIFVTLALTEESAGYTADSISVKAEKSGDDYVISGIKLFVPDAYGADYIICAARTKDSANKEDGITLFLVDGKADGLDITALDTFASDKLSEVNFNNVKVSKDNILGTVDNGWSVIKKVMQYAAIGKCAEMIGAAQKALELTIANATEREQFGVKVGSFQAVQHHCANTLTFVETSRLMTYQAAWRLSEGLPCDKEVSMTKSWVTDSCRGALALSHQATGGLAFMEEFDMQMYFRRVKAAGVYFGNADYHRELVAEEIGL